MIPPFQRAVILEVQSIVREHTGIEVSVKSVSVEPFINVIADDIMALDSRSDTLVFADEVVLKTDLREILKGRIRLNELRFCNVEADTRELVDSLCIKGHIGTLCVVSDPILPEKKYSLVQRLLLRDADVSLDILKQDKTKEAEDTTGGNFKWIFDVEQAELENVAFHMPSTQLDVNVGKCFLQGRAGIGEEYKVDTLDIKNSGVRLGNLEIPLDRLLLKASMDSTGIDVRRLYLKSQDVSCTAESTVELGTMTTDADVKIKAGEAQVSLTGRYCLKDGNYSAVADIRRFSDASIRKYIQLPDSCRFDGRLEVTGNSFNPLADTAGISVRALVDSASFGPATVGGTLIDAAVRGGRVEGTLTTSADYSNSSFNAAAAGTIKFTAAALTGERPVFDVNADFNHLGFVSDSLNIDVKDINVAAYTRYGGTAVDLTAPETHLSASSPSYALDFLEDVNGFVPVLKSQIDSMNLNVESLKQHLPMLKAGVSVRRGSPVVEFLQRYGISLADASFNADVSPQTGLNADVNIRDAVYDTLSLHSLAVGLKQNGDRLDCKADVDFRKQRGLPDIAAKINGYIGVNRSSVNLKVSSDIRDGILNIKDVAGKVGLDLTANLDRDLLSADGKLNLESLRYGGLDLGTHDVVFNMKPLGNDRYDIRADTDNFPLEMAEAMLDNKDIELNGAVRVRASATGSIDSLKTRVEVYPDSVSAFYKPYSVPVKLSAMPVVMEDMTVKFKDFPIYMADSSSMTVNGTCDLDKGLLLNLKLASERLRPSMLEKCDSIPVYGDAAISLNADISGTPDKLKAVADVSILPETEITYQIDKKNDVRVKPGGSVRVDYESGEELQLFGKVNVEEGVIRYSLPYYPLTPFNVNKGSNISFNGKFADMKLDVSATQPAKAVVGETSERLKEEQFIVGVQVKNSLDDLALDFIIKAPENDRLQKEIDDFTPEERNRVAAALLTTGMYISETNAAMADSKYALTSIVQKSANALVDNKLGKFVNIDFGVGKSGTGSNAVTDYSTTVSKNFLDDRLKLSVGGSYSEGEKNGKYSGNLSLLDNIALDWQIKKGGGTNLFLFHKKDYENVYDGDLEKDGIGVRTTLEWKDAARPFDPYKLSLEGNVTLRSNLQLGPYLSATFSKRDMLNRGETLSAKLYGAYYWKIVNRKGSGEDNFDIGLDLTYSEPRILFPGLQNNRIDGASSDFRLGYLYESVANIAKMNKFTAEVRYNFRSSDFISHEFSPFWFSFVNNDASEEYYSKISSQAMLRTILDNEHIPAMQYRLSYSDYFEKTRVANTAFCASVKESGNLISGIQAVCGKDFNEVGKGFLFKNYSQFLKLTFELRNRYRLAEKVSLAGRLMLGAILPYGNSVCSPFSEVYYIGGANSIRAFAPRTVGPGAYRATENDNYMLHTGELKFETNLELRFPLGWKLEGAVFADAGNVWMRKASKEIYGAGENFPGNILWSDMLNQIALGSGLGIRFVYQSLVIRLDWGIAIHAPYDTGKSSYYNIQNFWKEGCRLNFGIGYPF